MNEIYVPLPSKENIAFYAQQDFDGFIIGLEGFSSNFNSFVKVSELEDTIKELKQYDLKIFISFDRLYYNDEIDKVRDILLKIKKMDITGVFYTDIGVLNILNDIDFDKEIFWLSNHLGTNSKTLNFLEKRNVNSAILSNEICVDEILKIRKNTKIKLGIIMYGFLNMATSSRKLLTNYFSYTEKKKSKDKYYMKDKVKEGTYRVVEGDNTNFFTDKVLNGIKFYPKLIENNINFIILDDYMLNENNFYNIIEAFSSLRKAPEDKDFVEKLEKVVDANTYYETFYGFLDKKTVFKVEDYE